MIYAIKVTDLVTFQSRVSSVAYDSYVKAVHFCENRGDKPDKVDDYQFKSDKCRYLILPLSVE